MQIEAKLGPLSVSAGPEIAVGRTDQAPLFDGDKQIAGRFKASMTGSIRDLRNLEVKDLTNASLQVKVQAGLTISDKPTVRTESKTENVTVGTGKAALFGNGVELQGEAEGGKVKIMVGGTAGVSTSRSQLDVKNKTHFIGSKKVEADSTY